MSHSALDELLTRIHDYVTKLVRAPISAHKNPGEFQAVLAAWKTLNTMLPTVAKMSVDEFEKYLLTLIAMDVRDKLAFGAKWLQATPALSHPNPASAKIAGASAAQTRVVEPLKPPRNATASELAEYHRSLAKYNRMFEMYSKIMANSHEMKKALIGNLPR